jgi:hypothetical protein
MVSILLGSSKFCGDIAKALGLEHARKIDIHMEVNGVVIITAEYYMSNQQGQDISDVFKKYVLCLEEIPNGEDSLEAKSNTKINL